MPRRQHRRRISTSPAAYPRSLNVLEPGRTRRHPVPGLALALWAVATGFGATMAAVGFIAWLG